MPPDKRSPFGDWRKIRNIIIGAPNEEGSRLRLTRILCALPYFEEP
jgi:hypothetical protein